MPTNILKDGKLCRSCPFAAGFPSKFLNEPYDFTMRPDSWCQEESNAIHFSVLGADMSFGTNDSFLNIIKPNVLRCHSTRNLKTMPRHLPIFKILSVRVRLLCVCVFRFISGVYLKYGTSILDTHTGAGYIRHVLPPKNHSEPQTREDVLQQTRPHLVFDI